MATNIIIEKQDDATMPFAGQIPKVTVAGIQIPAQRFNWSFLSGVEPNTETFWVPPSISAQLDTLKNPVTFEISFPNYTGPAQQELSTLKLENMYLVHRAYPNLAQVSWTIADARWLLQGKKIYAVYNKTFIKNDNQTAYPTNNSPADLRQFFETLSFGRYVPWTVKANGKPYSMKEIIEIELSKLGIKIWANSINDLSYTVDNIIYNGLDAVKVIEEMLSLSRLGLGVRSSGELYLYSLTSFDNNVKNPVSTLKQDKVINGVLYAQDKSKARPKSIRVLFEKKIETLLVATKETRRTTDAGTYTVPLEPTTDELSWWTQEDINERRVVACINVLPVPYPVLIDGISRNPGEWVPITLYLKAFGLEESFLYGASAPWFNGGFENRFFLAMKTNFFKTSPLTADQEHQCQHIASTIREHWRKTYMIDPYFMDQIKKWEPRLCSVINNYDHHTAPSPVFCNYFYIPFARNPRALTDSSWTTGAFSWEVATDDPYLLNPSPAKCSIVNAQLGVFQVVFQRPLDPSVSMTGNFAISPVPNPSPDSASITLDFCYPIESHTMLTIFSVVWERNPQEKIFTEVPIEDPLQIDGNSGDRIKSQFYQMEIQAPILNANFPTWEIVSNVEYARFALPGRALAALPSGLSQFFGPGYTAILAALKKDRTIPLNESFLRAIAEYEASRIYQQFQDLYAGSLTVPGLRNDMILCGTLMSIAFEISAENGATTTFNFLDVIPFPTLETRLPQKYIDFLRRNVTRNDDVTYLHTAQ